MVKMAYPLSLGNKRDVHPAERRRVYGRSKYNRDGISDRILHTCSRFREIRHFRESRRSANQIYNINRWSCRFDTVDKMKVVATQRICSVPENAISYPDILGRQRLPILSCNAFNNIIRQPINRTRQALPSTFHGSCRNYKTDRFIAKRSFNATFSIISDRNDITSRRIHLFWIAECIRRGKEIGKAIIVGNDTANKLMDTHVSD